MILPKDKHYLLETLNKIQKVVESMPTKKECGCCKYFDIQTKRCAANEYMIPPESVQLSGCDLWDWDCVPF